MAQLPEFLAHTNDCAEKRLLRMGLITKPLSEIGRLRRTALVIEAYGAKIPSALFGLVKLPFRLVGRLFKKKSRLTDTYLDDPYITEFELPTARERAELSESDAA